MFRNRPDRPGHAAWQSYWSSQRQQPAFFAQGRLGRVVEKHWYAVVQQLAADADFKPRSVLEVAAGNGHLSQHLASLLADFRHSPAPMVACDFAPEAVRQLKQVQNLLPVQCDAAELPFRNGSFDLIVSQFGIEYAGIDAMKELARIASPNGYIALLLHHAHGMLFSENQGILAALGEFIDGRLLDHFGMLAKQPGRADVQARFVAAVKATEAVLHKHGKDIAAGALLHLYREVAAMHGNLPRYDPLDVAAWCDQSAAALGAYADRTRWMTEAALDPKALDQRVSLLIAEGLSPISVTPVLDGGQQDRPVAWSVVARRHNPGAGSQP